MHVKDIRKLLENGKYIDAEAAAIEAVRSDRLDAQAWVFLGEALLHRGYAGSAGRCFRRAWLLDPEAHWVERVESLLQRRVEGEERVDINALLLVPNVTVSAVIIVKNEESTIERCIASLQGAVDRILVFDNGSTDRTAEIAGTFQEVELRFLEWRESFGELRNEALRFVDTDWVLWVDGDESLHADDRFAVKEAAGLYQKLQKPVVLNIWHLNYVNGHIRHDISQGRLFRVGCDLRYFGRIHEQVGTGDGGIYDPRIHRSTIRIRYHHTGYEPDVIRSKDKIERNRTLLKRMVAEERDNPGWWYFLGRETIAGGWHSEALEYLEEAERAAERQPRFGRILDVYFMRLRVFQELGRTDDENVLLQRILELEPNHPNVGMILAERRMNEGRELLRKAKRHLQTSLRSFDSYRGTVSADRGIAGWKAAFSEAEVSLRFGLLAEAKAGYSSIEGKGAPVELLRRRGELVTEQTVRLSFARIRYTGPANGGRHEP